jgi:hypothetical protein
MAHFINNKNDFDSFNNLKNMDTVISNNIAKLSSSIKSNINSNINSNFNNNNNSSSTSSSSSYSNSSLSTTDESGKTIVHKSDIENINGEITSINDCYEIDKDGTKTKINCNKQHNKNTKSLSINENFSNLNNYGKSIKNIHK